MTRKILIIILSVITLGVTFTAQGKTKDTTVKHVLVLSEGGGQHLAFTQAAMQWLRSESESLGMEFTEINSTKPITCEYLRQFCCILQLDYPPYNWTDEAMSAFQQYIDKGHGGWVGLHHATLLGDFDGFQMSKWFSDFLGGIRFRNYIAPLATGELQVEQPNHPMMQGIASTLVIEDDEWYTYHENPRWHPDVLVLAHVDENSYTPSSNIRMGDHPAVWTNTQKKARNVYFIMGHSPKLLQNDGFKQMMRNALIYCTSQKPSKKR